LRSRKNRKEILQVKVEVKEEQERDKSRLRN
jgi:hypothetical protein